MRRRTRLALSGVVACLAVAVGGYGVHAFAVGSDSCRRPGLAHETADLLAQNGLYYVPQLRGPREASLYDSAYGLLTLQVLGEQPVVSVSAADAAQLREADPTGSPIWTRWYVLAIQRATGRSLLSPDDASAVARLLSPAGYFDDRPAGAPTPPSAAEQVATSAAALDILAAVDGESYTRSLASTRQWIAGIPTQFADNPYVLSLAATIMQHLGLAVPPQLVSDAVDWYGKLRTSRAQVDYNSVSHGLYGYTRILGMVGRTAQPDTAFLAPLFRSAADQADLQNAYYAAASWSALSGDRSVIAPLEQRLRDNLMSNGLVQQQVVLVGTIDATYEMVRILEANGEQGCTGLASGVLSSAKAQNWPSWDPISKGMWLATVQITGGEADTATRWATYDGLTQSMPDDLTSLNAKQWAVTVDLLKVIGGHVPRPTVRPWPVNDRLGVMAAAVAINAMKEVGQPVGQLSWVGQQDLAEALARPELTPTLQEYLDALRAYVALGGTVSETLRSQVRRRLAEVRGCPGLPDMMRSTPGEQTCDLVATRSAIEAASVVPNLDLVN